MHYLRTNVFSKQKEELLETVMEGESECVSDVQFISQSATPPRTISIQSRSILSHRDKRRLLLLSARQTKFSSASNATRNKHHSICAEELLCKFQLGQYNGLVGWRSQNAVAVSGIYESTQKGSVRGTVSGCRGIIDRCFVGQIPSSGDKLCSRSTSKDSRRRATGHCLPSLALGRPLRSQRVKTYSKMPQRKRPNLHLLQSRSLESTVPTR